MTEEKRTMLHPDLTLNQYQIIQKIGKGTYGMIFTAVDMVDDVEVVVKEQDIIKNPIVIDNEASTSYKANGHRNCIHLIDDFEINEFKFFVFEKLGMTLYRHVCFGVTLSRYNTVKFGCDLLDGLQFLHSKKICHRDLHSSNVMFDMDLTRAVIIDFGLATFNGHTSVRTDIRKSQYVSPFVQSGEIFDYRDDVLSMSYLLLLARQDHEQYLGKNSEDNLIKKWNLISGKKKNYGIAPKNYFLHSFFRELHQQVEKSINYANLRITLRSSIKMRTSAPYEFHMKNGVKFLKGTKAVRSSLPRKNKIQKY